MAGAALTSKKLGKLTQSNDCAAKLITVSLSRVYFYRPAMTVERLLAEHPPHALSLHSCNGDPSQKNWRRNQAVPTIWTDRFQTNGAVNPIESKIADFCKKKTEMGCLGLFPLRNPTINHAAPCLNKSTSLATSLSIFFRHPQNKKPTQGGFFVATKNGCLLVARARFELTTFGL